MAMVLNNISVIHKKQGKFVEALDYAKQSLKIREELGERSRTANTLALIALIYEEQNNHPAALQYLNKSLEIAKAINEREYIAGLSLYIGSIMRKTGQYSKALSWLEQAAAIAAEIKVLENERQATKELAETYAAVNDYKKAFKYHKKYKELNDSIFNEKNSKKMAELQTRFDFEKKEKEIQLLKKNEEIQQLNMKRQKTFTYSLLLISLLVVILALMIYARYRLKDRANRALGKEIEDHKQTAQKLRESEEKFRTMAEKSVVGIYILDDNGFKYVNPRFLEIFGYTREEVIGKDPLEFVLKEDRPLVLKNIRQRLDGEIEAVHYQFSGITSGGETIYLESYGARSLYQGQPAVIGTLIDITDRKKAEAELVRSQKMEAVAILAGGIAHDFNNLLSVAMGYLDMLKKRVKNDKSTFKMVNSVEKVSIQAVNLVDKFISFSKGGWMETQKIFLKDILKMTVNRHPEVKPLLSDVSIPDMLHPVYGDDWQLSEVIFSLLKNADEAMTEPKHVTVKAENITLDNENSYSLKQGDYLKITIIDNGRGIPPEQLEKIFDPYFSTKSTFSEKGLGLGLAICYSVMKKHNGHIAVQSQVGVGTTVELYLPASR
jgi:PAS domain S-box-containing protein